MGLFTGNPAKRRAKRQSVEQFMLDDYEIRVSSNEAAVVCVEAEQAGAPAEEIAKRMHVGCWEGAAREAVNYYPEAAVRRAFKDAVLEKRAAGLLAKAQVTSLMGPMFDDEVIASVREMIDVSHDPELQKAMQVRQLQEEYAHLMAVPLSSNVERIDEIRWHLEQLDAAPDQTLVDEVRQEMGVPKPPWES